MGGCAAADEHQEAERLTTSATITQASTAAGRRGLASSLVCGKVWLAAGIEVCSRNKVRKTLLYTRPRAHGGTCRRRFARQVTLLNQHLSFWTIALRVVNPGAAAS